MKFLKLLLAIFIFASCSSNLDNDGQGSELLSISDINKNELINAPLSQKIEYKRAHMKVLSNWIARNKNKLKDLMIANMEKSIKEDVELFKLEDLIELNNEKSARTSNEEIRKVKQSLDAFKEIGEESWVPAIFLERGSLNRLSKTDSNELTFLAVEDEDMNGELLTSYQIIESEGDDDDEILQPMNQELTPEIVGDNNLLVMELISLDDFEEYSDGSNSGGSSSGGSSSGGSSGPTPRFLKLDNMKIRDLKEGWPFRSEISIKAYKLTNVSPNTGYDCGNFVTSSVDCYTDTGNRIVRLKRSWKNDNRSYDWTIEKSTYISNDIIYYVIFEADVFPAVLKYSVISLPNGSTATISYRSWQQKYDEQSLSTKFNNQYGLPFAYNLNVDKSGIIKYNLK